MLLFKMQWLNKTLPLSADRASGLLCIVISIITCLTELGLVVSCDVCSSNGLASLTQFSCAADEERRSGLGY